MGADLYRQSTTNTEQKMREQRKDELYAVMQATGSEDARKAWLDAYDAAHNDNWYFRDSYNNSSLFWLLDLSWWQDLESLVGPNGDGVMVTGEDGYDDFSLYPSGMRKLIVELESRRDLFHTKLALMSAEDQEYFRDKLSRLTGFLHNAAEAGDTIYCSV